MEIETKIYETIDAHDIVSRYGKEKAIELCNLLKERFEIYRESKQRMTHVIKLQWITVIISYGGNFKEKFIMFEE